MAKNGEKMKKLDIKDKYLLDSFLDVYQIKASELSFTNLYAWRDKYKFHYIIFDDFLWIINVKEDHYYLSQPLGDYGQIKQLKKSIQSMKGFLKGRPFIIKKGDKRLIKILDDMNLSYHYHGVRNDFDYVYDFEKMQTLSGNKYHKKKNHINHFKKKYNYRFDLLNKSNMKDTEDIIRAWFSDKDDLDEKKAIEDVLSHYDMLQVSGGILYVEDVPVAFIIGERLNDETLVIHFEKGLSDYHGVYQMVFYEYVNTLRDYKYVNREQDLGIEGLRKAKLSYHPIEMIEKYNVRLL